MIKSAIVFNRNAQHLEFIIIAEDHLKQQFTEKVFYIFISLVNKTQYDSFLKFIFEILAQRLATYEQQCIYLRNTAFTIS